MDTPAFSFVIPTYRLRDVNETVECYDQHFWKNGHSVRIVVFDDSISANQALRAAQESAHKPRCAALPA
jgi:hypothetical protein